MAPAVSSACERFENSALLFGGDADAVVGDFEQQMLAVSAGTREAVTRMAPSLVNLAALEISCIRHWCSRT